MKKSLFVIISTLAAIATSYGWGDQGHRAIWAVAQNHLTPTTKAKVAALLQGTRTTYTATWLDKARSAGEQPPGGPFAQDSETRQFDQDFPDNALWHFVDLPIGGTSYATLPGFEGRFDVVQHIDQAIKVLEGADTSMSPSLALRVLVHLVGDIHQPLHCCTGYFDVTDLQHPVLQQGAAAAAFKQFGDRGGNQLFYGPGKFDELHAFFDGNLVADVAGGSSSYQELAEVIEENLKNVDASNNGDYHNWAQGWADESILKANDAYQQITFGAAELKPDGNGGQAIKSISITLPDNFEKQETDVVAKRLTQAAARLAALLNQIFGP
jgi:hypothetical protein